MTRVLLALSLLVAGCAAWQSHGGPAALDCTEKALAGRAERAAPDVLRVIVSGGKDWEAHLASLGKAVGVDVLGCALQHVHLAAPPEARVKAAKASQLHVYRGLKP